MIFLIEIYGSLSWNPLQQGNFHSVLYHIKEKYVEVQNPAKDVWTFSSVLKNLWCLWCIKIGIYTWNIWKNLWIGKDFQNRGRWWQRKNQGVFMRQRVEWISEDWRTKRWHPGQEIWKAKDAKNAITFRHNELYVCQYLPSLLWSPSEEKMDTCLLWKARWGQSQLKIQLHMNTHRHKNTHHEGEMRRAENAFWDKNGKC